MVGNLERPAFPRAPKRIDLHWRDDPLVPNSTPREVIFRNGSARHLSLSLCKVHRKKGCRKNTCNYVEIPRALPAICRSRLSTSLFLKQKIKHEITTQYLNKNRLMALGNEGLNVAHHLHGEIGVNLRAWSSHHLLMFEFKPILCRKREVTICAIKVVKRFNLTLWRWAIPSHDEKVYMTFFLIN